MNERKPKIPTRAPKPTAAVNTAIGVAGLVGFAVLSRRVRAFWTRIRQGLAILRDRRRYLVEVFAVQAAVWL